MAGVRYDDQVGFGDFTMQALSEFQGDLGVFFAPDNQGWLVHDFQVG